MEENSFQFKKALTLKNLLAFPLLTIQFLVLFYFILVLVWCLPPISYFYPLHLLILLALFCLTGVSLVQTFITDPGKITVDILEQIKLRLKFEMPEESVDLDLSQNDSLRETNSK